MKNRIFATLVFFAAIAAQAASYDMLVETFVGGKLEDKFSFRLEDGVVQEKGFDTRIYAKRYRAEGWRPAAIERKEAEAAEAAEAEKSAAKKPLELAREKLSALENQISSNERHTEILASKSKELSEKRDALAAVIEKASRSSSAFEAAYAKYLEQYEPKDEEDIKYQKLMKRVPKNTGDVDIVDLGSFCRVKVVKSTEKSIRVNLDFAYVRILSAFYSDGNNNGNSITKFPVFERFEKFGAENVKFSFGVPYCMQFGRPSPEEARSLQDVISSSSIFAGTSAGKAQLQLQLPTYQASSLDAQGTYSEIKDNFPQDAGRTIRVVVTVKKVQ